MPSLLDPIMIGSLRLQNRIVMPPMATGLATERGEVTQDLIQHYECRANGLGLLIVEHSYVDVGGKFSTRQLGIHDERLIPSLKELTERVHAAGTPVAMQINHAGRMATSKVCSQQPVSPSAVKHADHLEVPRELSKSEIHGLVESFGSAAQRVRRAGFDAVEVHGAHGFLLNQFLSPLSNKRSDEYGGSLENRMRFPLEIVARIKDEVGDFPLLYRLGADDMSPGGFTLQEGKSLAKRLEEAGVHAIDVSGGMIGSRPERLKGQGYFIPLAEEIKRTIDIPVIGVGGIKTANYADEVIKSGRADLVAIGRAILADPRWATKAAETLKKSEQ